MGLEPRKSIKNIAPYSPGKSISEVMREKGLSHIVKMASNENPLGPSVAWEELIGEFNSIHHYPSYSHSPIKTAIAAKNNLNFENVILGNGSDELIQILALAYVNPGDEVLSSEITFSEYEFVSKISDANHITAQMNTLRVSLENLLAKVTEKTRVIFIANPNNPTGSYINHDDLYTFLEKLPDSCILVLDEAYVEYATAADFPRSLELLNNFQNVVILRTFSKIYGLAGLRIGYGLANSEVISTMLQVAQPFNVNSIALKAAELAYHNTDYISRSRELNKVGKNQLEHGLDELGLRYEKSQTNFICIHLPIDAKVVMDALMDNGIIIRSLASFGLNKSIRVTIDTAENNTKFLHELRRLL
jgi:histidinol-phosphate aminotransferase